MVCEVISAYIHFWLLKWVLQKMSFCYIFAFFCQLLLSVKFESLLQKNMQKQEKKNK